MENFLTEKELDTYQEFLNGKIVITKYNEEYIDDVEYTILCYKGKCYDIYNGEISNEKQMNRDFIRAILATRTCIEVFDVKLIIEKYKGKILGLAGDLFLYINDNLIFTEGFEKISLINYITRVHEQSIYYDTISDKNIVDLNQEDGKLETIKEEDEEDEVDRILKEIQI